MATKSIPQNDSIFEKVADFMVYDDFIVVSDPCYLINFDENAPFIAVPIAHHWAKGVSTATVFKVKSSRGTRALVLTTLMEPPVGLLDTKLTGHFYIVDHVGVDSGCVGFYNDDYVTAVEGKEWDSESPIETSNGYWCETFRGDGLFPVVVWAENGIPHTFAVLTDMSYYE